MAEKSEIWVFSENTSLVSELVGGALGLAEKMGAAVAVVVYGPKDAAEQAVSLGASRCLWLGEPGTDGQVEDCVPTLAGLVREHSPVAVLVGATRRGKAIAGRLAASLGVSAVVDVKEFLVEGAALQARHMIFGGGANRLEQASGATLLATVAQGIFEPAREEASRKGEVVRVPFLEPEHRVRRLDRRVKSATSINIAAAKRVVCPGRGVGKQEDLKMIEDLAVLLEAEIGCTRPLVEGVNWLPHERYIGVSGAFIKPELYIGIGVSGQVQHTVGVTDSKVIVAINKDEHAPIFNQSDYGITGNLYEIVPALIQALQARK